MRATWQEEFDVVMDCCNGVMLVDDIHCTGVTPLIAFMHTCQRDMSVHEFSVGDQGCHSWCMAPFVTVPGSSIQVDGETIITTEMRNSHIYIAVQ